MRRWVVCGVALLLLQACEFSHVDPQQTVSISGRALDDNGQPLRGAKVHLYKEPDAGEALIGTVLVLGSLGGVCLFPGAPDVCTKGRTATTAADGSYTFTMKGSDTQGLIGDASTLDVVVGDPHGGSRAGSTTLRFKVRQNTTALPDARVWKATPSVQPTAGRHAWNVSWPALPPADGTGTKYSAQLLDPRSGFPLWSQPAKGNAASIDARVLEDHAADATVVAHATLPGATAIYYSARTAVTPIAGAPPSRSKPCFAVTGTTSLSTSPQQPCGATDGNLTSASRLAGPNGATATGVVVDLQTARPVSFVVGRGLAGSVLVEVSADGRTYTQIATGTNSSVGVAPPGAPTARYVRVRSPAGLSESLLSEISVW
jgi:hypothetical protein